jgi:RimJ/RimL family protein N-acetyltransferase
MDELKLVPISINDMAVFDKTEYKNLSVDKRKKLIEDSKLGQAFGEFFRFTLIKVYNEVVGVVNISGHGKNVVSVAPEIFLEYRGKGYGKKALIIAYDLVKEWGFKELTAGIREENETSQHLHEKLGFIHIGNKVSKNGNSLKIYSRKV